jgi:hypothetical protein
MADFTSRPLNPDKGWVRYLGILTAIGFAVLIVSESTLSRRNATIVGGLALLFILGAGTQFLFHGATLVSLALHGRRRARFQIALSIAVPVLITFLLASRADAIPAQTLWTILTPWLLIPLGIIAVVSWSAGSLMHREHPFRGFLMAAAILGVLALLWSYGMVSESSDYDDGGGLYLDPKRAKRAQETGEYVWRFVLYITVAEGATVSYCYRARS